MTLGRREIKSITVEYEDGDVETHIAEGMYQVSRMNYPGGANPKPGDGFIVNQINWTWPKKQRLERTL